MVSRIPGDPHAKFPDQRQARNYRQHLWSALLKLGMISTRFNGLDGVSLESSKLADVLEEAGHTVAWFAGELGPRFSPGRLHPSAHFETESNRRLEAACFGAFRRTPEITAELRDATEELKAALRAFIADFSIDVAISQNALCLPMQLPLGLALTEVAAELDLPVIAHHHDFSWERERFDVHAVPDILGAAFPPLLHRMRHIVIQSSARTELERRRGVTPTLLPNVMDFERGPAEPGVGSRFRDHAGLAEDDIVLLQPTRVVPRKGIEISIDLAAALGDPRVKVVITHPEGDEGREYGRSLREQAGRLGVDLRFVEPQRFEGQSREAALGDAYAAADLVCFPSLFEGFGNALLEAFFHRRPVFVNRYSAYVNDIAPTGVKCIEVDGGLDPLAVETVRELLENPSEWKDAVDDNYEIGRRCFSYQVIRERILPLVDEVMSIGV
jgi:glycosyltransferase involved in cell wall biosynthesis